MDFFSIIKQIEKEKLKSNFNENYQKFLSQIKKDKFLNDLKPNLDSLQCELDDALDNIEKIYSNDKFDKVRKYKIIFFLYGLWINYQFYVNNPFISNFEERSQNFFHNSKDNKYEWKAFKQGPALSSHYRNNNYDKVIELNWDNWTDNERKIFTRGWNVLNTYPTQDLINESHKLNLWIKNWTKNNYYNKINNQDIVNHFKETLPFFIKDN